MRRLLAGTALLVASALPGLAEGLTDMTPAEREAFRAEVRAYLMEHPEVLMEAISVLEGREQAAAAERASKASGASPAPRSNPTPPRAP